MERDMEMAVHNFNAAARNILYRCLYALAYNTDKYGLWIICTLQNYLNNLRYWTV
jgi:hypothetical protein